MAPTGGAARAHAHTYCVLRTAYRVPVPDLELATRKRRKVWLRESAELATPCTSAQWPFQFILSYFRLY